MEGNKITKKLRGIHTIDSPVPGPKAGRLPNKSWGVYEVSNRTRGNSGNPSDGGSVAVLNRIGVVEGADIGDALNRANSKYGADSVDYIEPDGVFPERKVGAVLRGKDPNKTPPKKEKGR